MAFQELEAMRMEKHPQATNSMFKGPEYKRTGERRKYVLDILTVKR